MDIVVIDSQNKPKKQRRPYRRHVSKSQLFKLIEEFNGACNNQDKRQAFNFMTQYGQIKAIINSDYQYYRALNIHPKELLKDLKVKFMVHVLTAFLED